MNQIEIESQRCHELFTDAMDAYTDAMDSSKCGTDYYIPVFSDRKIKQNYEMIVKMTANHKANLQATAGQFNEEAHIVLQEDARIAAEHVRETTKMIEAVKDKVDAEKAVANQERLRKLKRSWILFWGVSLLVYILIVLVVWSHIKNG